MKKFFLWSTLLVTLIIMCVAVGGYLYLQGYGQKKLLNNQQTLNVNIPSGTSVRQLSQQLVSQGLVKEPWSFEVYVRYRGKALQLKAGEYAVPAQSSIDELIALLVSGKTRQYTITFVEGWTVRQALEVLAQAPKIEHTITPDQWQKLPELLGFKSTYSHPEGLIFPDTYAYSAGTKDTALLKRAYEKMERTLAEEWPKRAQNLPYQNVYEALIMASIVEKETGVPEERPAIAGVFVRRLQKNMRLQTDPTVIYGIGERYTGNITRKHLQQDTPYNTYRIMGLPPTPIALPGKLAIQAALHPAPGNSLYFVAKGDGSHHFSSSLSEHNRAVRKYQLRRRQDYRSNPQAN
ncbi:endolytic transglycosylase MltG [Zooshikella marina]|uniref:endolytic transglycosylase MltG n=1 Tax=Zooshikella ganghwensis TaxID=202772 RepID=UPI001BAE8DB5|nr:endolytic transglycosylase MltG [Zooshikella ganghwensis]MBU2705196.1 endolytic transglycosylase MltG [Zooshikella ganghwensis]